MKTVLKPLSLMSVLLMSMLSFGGKGGWLLSKDFFQTIEPELFERVQQIKKNADADYKAGFKDFLHARISRAAQGMCGNKDVTHDESDYLTASNDSEKRSITAHYADAADKAMEALKCIRAGCYVESKTNFDFAQAFGLKKVSQEKYSERLAQIVGEDGWTPFKLEGSLLLAEILLEDLDEESK